MFRVCNAITRLRVVVTLISFISDLKTHRMTSNVIDQHVPTFDMNIPSIGVKVSKNVSKILLAAALFILDL